MMSRPVDRQYGSAVSEETDEVTDDEPVTVEGPGEPTRDRQDVQSGVGVAGIGQTFTIEVSNDGSADASDVSITDNVNPYADVTDVSLTSVTGDCSASSGQNVDCTVDVPAGESVTVTVAYVAPSFLPLPEGPLFGASGGSEFRFVFMNGYVLEGAAEAAVTLYNESGAAVATYTGDKKTTSSSTHRRSTGLTIPDSRCTCRARISTPAGTGRRADQSPELTTSGRSRPSGSIATRRANPSRTVAVGSFHSKSSIRLRQQVATRRFPTPQPWRSNHLDH